MEAGLGLTSFLFLDIDGGVLGYGPADCHMLQEAKYVEMKPRKIPNIPPIASISVGHSFAVYLDTEGNLWINGIFKGTKLPKTTMVCLDINPKQIKALEERFYVTTEEGDVWKFGVYHHPVFEKWTEMTRQALISTKQKLTNIPAIRHISGGKNHTLFIDMNGGLWSGGDNSNGQLGRSSLINSEILAIEHPGTFVDACGGVDHSLFLDRDGNVWSCGSNRFGQLGIPLSEPGAFKLTKVEDIARIQFICVGGYSSILIDEFGNTWACGKNLNGKLGLECDLNTNDLQIVPGIPKMQIAFCEDEHAIYVDEDDNVYACGLNRGQFDQDIRKTSILSRPYSEILNIPLMRKSVSSTKSARNV